MTHSQKIKLARSNKESAEKKLAELLDSIPEAVSLNKEIDSHLEELEKLKATCPHENHIAKYGGNTGNYDPTADIYWVEVECFDCGRLMHYYDSQPEYRNNWKTK